MDRKEKAAFAARKIAEFDSAFASALRVRTFGLIEASDGALYGEGRFSVSVSLTRHAPMGVRVRENREVRVFFPVREGGDWIIDGGGRQSIRGSLATIVEVILGQLLPQVNILRGHQAIAWWNQNRHGELAAPLGIGKLRPGWLDAWRVDSREQNTANATADQIEAVWAAVIEGDYKSLHTPALDWKTPPE